MSELHTTNIANGRTDSATSKQPAAAAAPAKADASDLYSLDLFRQPIGYFRVVELVLSLVVLSLFFDVSGLRAYSELTAVLGISLLTLLYTTSLLPLYLLHPYLSCTPNPYLHFLHAHTPLLCLLLDFALTCMLLASTVAAAWRCGSTLYVEGVSQHIALCQSQVGYNVEVGVALEFVLTVVMAVSCKLEWGRVMTVEEPMKEQLLTKV